MPPVQKNARPLVSFVIPDLGLAGAEIVSTTLAKELLKRGYAADIVTLIDIDGVVQALPEGARHIRLSCPKIRNLPVAFAQYLRRANPAAVVASLWPITSACIVGHRLALSRARVLVWEHSTLSVQYASWGALHRRLLRASLAWTFPLADARVAVSKGVAEDLSALSGLRLGRFDVIYNPISVAAQGDDAAAESAWGGWTGPRILTVGRLKSVKNHPLLIRAFKKLLQTRDARLMIVGEGECAPQIRECAAAEGVADKVLTPGATTDPGPYYRSADLFVLSSDREGFGNVIVEAMSCGVPVVSTSCKFGPEEILGGGRWGRLVPVGDADALAEAMDGALSAPHDRDALKRRAAEFAPDRIADRFERLLFPQIAAPPEPTAFQAEH
jgi:glycosyltransferase involved in cell wall biosynthesis